MSCKNLEHVQKLLLTRVVSEEKFEGMTRHSIAMLFLVTLNVPPSKMQHWEDEHWEDVVDADGSWGSCRGQDVYDSRAACTDRVLASTPSACKALCSVTPGCTAIELDDHLNYRPLDGHRSHLASDSIAVPFELSCVLWTCNVTTTSGVARHRCSRRRTSAERRERVKANAEHKPEPDRGTPGLTQADVLRDVDLRVHGDCRFPRHSWNDRICVHGGTGLPGSSPQTHLPGIEMAFRCGE